MQWVRPFATKRTIPYVTKGNWKLPALKSLAKNTEPIQSLEPNQSELGNRLASLNQDSYQSRSPKQYFGSGPKPIQDVNVPKGWRQMRNLPQWKRQKFSLREKFPDGWKPLKKLDRAQMDRLREIKAKNPAIKAHELGEMFKVSPEIVRRILKSRWQPSTKEAERIEQRWIRRGQRLGAKPIIQPGTKRLFDYGQKIF